MGLLDSPYMGQLVNSGTIEKTFSSTTTLGGNIKLNGRNVIKFKISVSSGSLSVDGNLIRMKGGILNKGWEDIYCRSIEHNITSNDDNYLSATATQKLIAGDWVSMDVSPYEYIQFYGYASEQVSVKIEYVAAYEDVLTRTANTRLNDLKTAIAGLNSDVSSGFSSLAGYLLHPVDVLVFSKTIDASKTGNHFFDVDLGTLDARYTALKMNFNFSAIDNNVRFILYEVGGTTTDGNRNQRYFVDENGDMATSLPAPNTTDNRNRSFYVTELARRYLLRVDTAGGANLSCTLNVFATVAVPEIRHIQLVTQISNTLSLDTARYTNKTLNSYIRRFKFFFITVEGTGLTGDIHTDAIIDGMDSNVITEFESKNKVATKWIPVTFDNITITSLLKGDGAMDMKVFGVI